MTESSYNSELTEYLKNAGCIVFKHSDHFTTGVPDNSCTVGGYTTWFEVKVIKPTELITQRLLLPKDRVQLFMMVGLQTLGRAFYLIRWNNRLWVFPPSVIMHQKDKSHAEGHHIITGAATHVTEFNRNTPPPWVTSANNYKFVLDLARSTYEHARISA